MNRWEDMFEIYQKLKLNTRADGSVFETLPYHIRYKSTGEDYFPKTRQYGYSHKVQAKIAASRQFNAWKKSIEKDLLDG